MTTQSDGGASDRDDAGSPDRPTGDDVAVDRRPDSAGYPTAEDAGAVVPDEQPTADDDRDRAGYPDAGESAAPT